MCSPDSRTISEHGASCYGLSSSPSTGSPNWMPTGNVLGLPTLQQTPEGSLQDSPNESPHLSHDDSPNSVTTGPNIAKNVLQPCKICALNPAKVCLQVWSLPMSLQRSYFIIRLCNFCIVCLGCWHDVWMVAGLWTYWLLLWMSPHLPNLFIPNKRVAPSTGQLPSCQSLGSIFERCF